MSEENNIVLFEDDCSFTDYCLNSNPNIQSDDDMNICYYDYDYNPIYLAACKAGKCFKITDPKSLVNKRKAVTRGLITKPVSNLIVD